MSILHVRRACHGAVIVKRGCAHILTAPRNLSAVRRSNAELVRGWSSWLDNHLRNLKQSLQEIEITEDMILH